MAAIACFLFFSKMKVGGLPLLAFLKRRLGAAIASFLFFENEGWGPPLLAFF